MPRNREENVYIYVPLPKGSLLHEHLLTEAAQGQAGKRADLGPYLARLLEDRDRCLYGEGKGQALWFVSNPAYLAGVVEQAVQQALHAALPNLLADLPLISGTPHPLEQVSVSEEALMDQEAAALARSLGAFDEEE